MLISICNSVLLPNHELELLPSHISIAGEDDGFLISLYRPSLARTTSDTVVDHLLTLSASDGRSSNMTVAAALTMKLTREPLGEGNYSQYTLTTELEREKWILLKVGNILHITLIENRFVGLISACFVWSNVFLCWNQKYTVEWIKFLHF